MAEAENKTIICLLGILVLLAIIQIASIEYFLDRFSDKMPVAKIMHDKKIQELLADNVLSLSLQQQYDEITASTTATITKEQHQQQHQITEEHKTQKEEGGNAGIDIPSADVTSDITLRSLEEILKRAKVEVTEEIRKQLPPKEDVLSMYGEKPIILGLDRCETFRNTVVKGDAFIGPAGMFNTVREENSWS